MADKTPLEVAQETLLRIQSYNLQSLVRKDELGPFSFEDAVAPAFRVQALFSRIPVEILKDLTNGARDNIKNEANAILNLFQQIEGFDTAQASPMDTRRTIIENIRNRYEASLSALHPWISYATSRTTDFVALTAEARTAVQTIEKQGEQIEQRMGEREKRIAELEEQLRQSLAKQGVGKQAQYFEGEAKIHATEADKWGRRTWRWAFALAILAFASFFTHRIPWIAPKDTPEAIQFVASKLLLFGILTFMLVRSSRNYLAHKHNEVVNRHKQNALLTFNALVEAGATPETRNTVLNHAASSIYATPDSGYVRASGDGGPSNTTLVELLPRATARLGDGT